MHLAIRFIQKPECYLLSGNVYLSSNPTYSLLLATFIFDTLFGHQLPLVLLYTLYTVRRTLLGTLATAGTFGIVNDGQIIDYGYGTYLTDLGAQSAGNTSGTTNRPNVLAFLMIFARNVKFCVSRYPINYLFRTRLVAHAASTTLRIINLCNTFIVHIDSIVLAHVGTSTHTHTS